MYNYFFNNKKMIEWYRQLLEGGLSVKSLLEHYHNNSLLKNALIDHTRFRVFLDSCMLLFNKDRLDTELLKKFSFIDYLKDVNATPINQEITSRVNEHLRHDSSISINSVEQIKLFYSYDNKNIKPWEQAKIIRNCFAHAHHAFFRFSKRGNIYYYDVDNIDAEKGIKEHGFVIEHFIHEWIKKFFSYYPGIGIPYSHAFIMIEDMQPPYWISVKLSPKYEHKFSGESCHPLNELAYIMYDLEALSTYIGNHPDDLELNKQPLENLFSANEAKALITQYNLFPSDYTEGRPLLYYPLVHYAIKMILSPQIELSNFLLSISLLNDTIIQAINDADNSANMSVEECNNSKNAIESSLKELQEDESAILSFRVGLSLLGAWNIAYRLENKKFPTLDSNSISIEGIQYNNTELNGQSPKEFVLERFRNSLMHGNIKMEMDCSLGVIVIFEDRYHDDIKTIEIPLSALDNFIEQQAFYDHVSDAGM